MINTIFYFYAGIITFLIFVSCVHPLTCSTNPHILKNNKNIIIENTNNYNNGINIGMLGTPIQKIFFLNSNKVMNIYKNYYKNDDNIFILKMDMNRDENKIEIDENFMIVKSTEQIYLPMDLNPMDLNPINLVQTDFLFCNDLFEKKLINISPGGLYGYYDAGICSIIKKKYNLNNYIFSGASAGAWNSLFMSYKNDTESLLKNMLSVDVDFASIKNLQTTLKEKILKFHKTEEFDLKKIFITVCVLDKYGFQNHIYTDFVDLEDAIDCCVASSNIPFVTGNLVHRYRNKIAFDGGFLTNQSIVFKKSYFNIGNKIWGKKRFFTSLFTKPSKNKNILTIFIEGVEDTNSNTHVLDDEFL